MSDRYNHYIPSNDKFVHLFSIDCKCKPELKMASQVNRYVTGSDYQVYVHKCLDRDDTKIDSYFVIM